MQLSMRSIRVWTGVLFLSLAAVLVTERGAACGRMSYTAHETR